MDEALSLLEKVLRNNQYSFTDARKRVFVSLYGQEPQSMHEIELTIGKAINRTSIYRVIELFEKMGLIRKIQIGWKYKIELSDVFVEHHHHISCLGCGKIIVIHEDKRIEKLINKLALEHHIQSPVHQLEIQGYCKACSF